MRVHYRTASGRMTFELEGDQKQVFEGVATVQQIFEAASACGLCGSTNIHFCVRAIDANKYYELRCSECNAQLSFGQHKTGGTLFPKRKDEAGNYIPNNGWYKYRKESE